MMNKNIYLCVVLFLSIFCGGQARAAAKAYALWCEGNKTVYYVYGETAYAAGGTYDGQTITTVYENKVATKQVWEEEEWYEWDTGFTSQIQRVVLTNGYCTAKIKDLACLFAGMTNLTTIVGLENLNTSEATTLEGMFWDCNIITSLDLSNFNTSKVTNMAAMFYACLKLTEIKGLDHFDTSNVTNMNSMFWACSSMNSIDVSHFNTSKVESMGLMFCACSKLESLDLRNFDTSNVMDFDDMFDRCGALKSVNLSSFDTSKATSMYNMFGNCYNLMSLDVSHFNTENVTTMAKMFSYCIKITSINLCNFNTYNVTDMTSMFYGNKELTTIYCNDSWSATKSVDMFTNCTKLVGAIAYNKTKTTVEYANPTTGYFTQIGVIPTVMTFSSTTATATCGQAFTPPTLTKPDEISVVYSSDNPAVAKVDANTGAVTLLHSGVATITASFAGNDGYTAASASYQLTVKAKTLGLSIGGVVMNTDFLANSAELTAALDGILTAGTVALTSGTDLNNLTLTLNNAKLQSESNDCIKNTATLNLVVEGSNEVTSTSSISAGLYNTGTITFTGSGQLKVKGYNIGISTTGTIILSGPTVEVSARTTSVYGTESSVLKILGGTLIAAGAERSTIEVGSLELGPGVVISQPAGAWWDASNHILSIDEGYGIRTQVTITGNAVANDLKFASATASTKIGADFTAPALTNPHSLAVTYTSSKTDVAEVDASTGKVTVKKPGETTITASFAGSADYLAGSVSYTLTVSKGDVTLTYSAATASVVFGAEFTAPTLTVTPESLKNSVTFTSSNEAVAKISGSGIIVFGAGEATIKAAFAGNDLYNGAEASYKLTVTPAAATMAFQTTECSTTVGASFNSPQLVITTPSSLAVKYSSSNTDIATVGEESGVVVGKAEGTVTITATSADPNYTGSASYKLTITLNESGLLFANTAVTATYGAAFTAPELKNEHGLTVKYESSNKTVATVDETSGKVTLLKAGETTITAKFGGNDEYAPASASYVLTVKKAKATLTFSQTECKAAVRRDFKAPKLTTNPDGLTVKYTSSDPSVANVNEITGFVVALAKGEATITANVVNDQYEGSASYKLTVIDPIPGDANTDFKLSADDIMAIVEDMLGYRPEGFDTYMSDMNGDNNFNIADIIKIVNAITGN